MENLRIRTIMMTMAVSFTASFALMLWQRKAEYGSASIPESIPESTSLAGAVGTPVGDAPVRNSPPPYAAPQGPIAIVPSAAREPTAASTSVPASKPVSEDAAPDPPLPIAFHIADHRDLNRIEGEIRNVSSNPLSVTLTAVNAKTQGTTQLQLELAPGETKPYSTDDGLVMYAHDQLIVHSPSFQDRIVKVP